MTLKEYLEIRKKAGADPKVRGYVEYLPNIHWKKVPFRNKEVPHEVGKYRLEWYSVDEVNADKCVVSTFRACRYYDPDLQGYSNRLYKNGVLQSQNLPYDNEVAAIWNDMRVMVEEQAKVKFAEEKRKKAEEKAARAQEVQKEKYKIYRYLANTLGECEQWSLADIIEKKKQRGSDIVIETSKDDKPKWWFISENGKPILMVAGYYYNGDYAYTDPDCIAAIDVFVLKEGIVRQERGVPHDTALSIFGDVYALYEAQEQARAKQKALEASAKTAAFYKGLLEDRTSK